MRRRGLTNAEVVKYFLAGDAGESESMHTDGRVCYSYGAAIAVKIDGGVLNNIDRFSKTTSTHQSALRHGLRMLDGIIKVADVSFSLLEQHGADITSSRVRDMTSILDIQKYQQFHVYKHQTVHEVSSPENPELTIDLVSPEKKAEEALTYDNFRQQMRQKFGQLGEFHTYYKGEKNENMTFHIAGSCLLKVGISIFWCSQDAGQYFIVELTDRSCHSIERAIKSMQPIDVRNTDFAVIRQGEYFFIPSSVASRHWLTMCKEDKKLFKWYCIPDRRSIHDKGTPQMSKCHHVAKEAVEYAGQQYVHGYVLDAQHRKTELPEDCWYSVHHNVCLRSMSTNRKID